MRVRMGRMSATMTAGSYNPAPPIPFVEKDRKSSSIDAVELNLKTNPALQNNTTQRYKRKFQVFQNGNPEQVIQWRKDFAIIELLLPLSTGTSLLEMARNLTYGRAKNIFDTKFRAALATANANLAPGTTPLTKATVTQVVVNQALNNFIAYFFPHEGALGIQKYVIRRKSVKAAKIIMINFQIGLIESTFI